MMCNGENSPIDSLPLFVSGKVVKGFGRGSAEIGIRTANYDLETVKKYGAKLKPGVYAGYCTVSSYEGIFKCVVNVGWCPFYNNEHMSIEAHIMNEFDPLLFYDKSMKIIFLRYMRGEMNFDSLDGLITAIRNDIDQSAKTLEKDYQNYKTCPFFVDN